MEQQIFFYQKLSKSSLSNFTNSYFAFIKIKSEKILQIALQANRTFPSFVGQLFEYNVKEGKVEIIPGGALLGFRIRWFFLLLNAAITLLRIFNDHLFAKTETEIGLHKKAHLNLSVMMFLICILAGERYRLRAKCPQDYVAFFNGTIQIEWNFSKGL